MAVTEYTSRLLPPTFSMDCFPTEDPLRKFLSSVVSCLFVASVLFPLAGCIAHAPSKSGGGGGNQQTTVTVTPTAATVSGGSTTTFTATVTGPQETAVTWNVNGIQNGNSTVGTLTAGTNSSGTTTAVYTAPTTVPTPPTVSITAVSVANNTSSAPSTVTITPSTVNVAISPTTATVDAGTTQTFTATVTGTTNFGVGWYVNDILNGNSSVGTITASSTSTGSTAIYTAPTVAPSNAFPATITAVSVADAGAVGTAVATIPPIVVTLSPASGVSIPVSGTQEFTATVTGTGDTAVVNWQVNGISGGNSNIGTIAQTSSNAAVYTAPATVSASPFIITISAVSGADSFSIGQIQGNVHVTVSISPATDSIGQGANLQYTATVNGAPNTAQGQDVVWSASCPTCQGGQTGGTFDPNNPGLYVAPGLQQGTTSATVTVTATPNFDPTQPGTATMNVQQTDPLGTVSNVQSLSPSQCPADSNGKLTNGTCYSMTVSCDGVSDLTSYLKVNATATPVGTVLFLIGGGGNGLYDSNPSWAYGYEAVENVFNANFNTVQVSFGLPFNANQPNGWLQGPGGVRRLACRYATVADWVYNNPKMINPGTSSTTSAPFCATGNSGGSGALAYAAFEYGLAGAASTGPTQEFSFIEPTSGPVMTRLDQACVCNNNAMGPKGPCTTDTGPTPMCFSPSEAAIIDPAYQVQGQSNQPTLCSNGLSGTDTANANRFASDSIEYAPNNALPIPLSKSVIVNMRFGGYDTTTAVPQGEVWWGAVSPKPTAPACSESAGHEIPDDNQGAIDIANDIVTGCH